MRNYTYDTRLGVFISVMDRNNFHLVQTSMFLESDTPKEQNLRLVNMKVSMYFLLENLSCERKDTIYILRDFMSVIIDVFSSFMQEEINIGVHTTPDLDPNMESNVTNEVDSILKTLCLEPYIPNFKEQVCIYHKSQIRF